MCSFDTKNRHRKSHAWAPLSRLRIDPPPPTKEAKKKQVLLLICHLYNYILASANSPESSQHFSDFRRWIFPRHLIFGIGYW
jgi:hypothetical protein